ncbi:hypothetical protein HYU95_04385 [Candidatus Daviesbacteria bacterium]|nr:hypothetical protein [Candidatus Daviesbacteria bacterium]
MSGFTEIATSRGMQKFYGVVAEKINVPAHSDFVSRPIKVLDICGGIGAVGKALHQQCESVMGKLSPEDFAVLVDYVNIDLDEEALKQSPGRTRWEDATYLYDRLRQEPPFDYILALNQNPNVQRFSSTQLNRMGFKDESLGNPIRNNLMAAPHAQRHLAARATLISAALLLQEGSLYLWSGFIGQESFSGTAKASKELGLGLRIVADERIALDEATLESFVTYDTGKTKGKYFARVMEEYRKTFKLVTLQARGVVSTAAAQAALTKTLQDFRDWSTYCEVQDRFWN